MNIRQHTPHGNHWLQHLHNHIGTEAATRLKNDWPLAQAVNRTSWQNVWDIFDQARQHPDFHTVTTAQWDAAEAALVATGGVDSRQKLQQAQQALNDLLP